MRIFGKLTNVHDTRFYDGFVQGVTTPTFLRGYRLPESINLWRWADLEIATNLKKTSESIHEK